MHLIRLALVFSFATFASACVAPDLSGDPEEEEEEPTPEPTPEAAQLLYEWQPSVVEGRLGLGLAWTADLEVWADGEPARLEGDHVVQLRNLDTQAVAAVADLVSWGEDATTYQVRIGAPETGDYVVELRPAAQPETVTDVAGFATFHAIAGWGEQDWARSWDEVDPAWGDHADTVIDTFRQFEGLGIPWALQALDADGLPLSGSAILSVDAWPAADAPDTWIASHGQLTGFVTETDSPEGSLALVGEQGLALPELTFESVPVGDVDASWSVEATFDGGLTVAVQDPSGDAVRSGIDNDSFVTDVTQFVGDVDGGTPDSDCGWELRFDAAGDAHDLEVCVGTECRTVTVGGELEAHFGKDCYDD